MKTPEGIERLTPSAVWQDGYRQGREDLAREMQRDALAAAASEAPEAKLAAEARLATVERELLNVQTEQRDGAGVVREALKRLAAVEVEVRHLTEDGR